VAVGGVFVWVILAANMGFDATAGGMRL